jgi:hypothetical protein
MASEIFHNLASDGGAQPRDVPWEKGGYAPLSTPPAARTAGARVSAPAPGARRRG